MEDGDELRRGRVQDEYVVVKAVSKGSYGDVFVAQRRVDGKRVCLKQVDLEFLSPDERLGCVAEVALLRSLPPHAHVVQCLDAFVDEAYAANSDATRLILVLEYGDAGDLDSLIHGTADTRLSIDTALPIFAQLVSGLSFLHSHLILHRDIKSKNVFRFTDGRVVIGDLGTSKSLTQTTPLATTLVGSPLYMSPELLDGHAYSYPSDIWSLGCVLYELLTGTTPFSAASYPAVVFKISKGVYEPLPSTVPAELSELVARMLSLDPAARPTIDDIAVMPLVQQHLPSYSVSEMEISDKTKTEMILLPPPPPTCAVVATGTSAGTLLPPPPPVVAARASPTQAMYPTARASLANILSRERLHVHRQRQQEAPSPSTLLSCVPVMDSTVVVTPSKPLPLRRPSRTNTATRPKANAATLPPETMMVIGKKVHSVLTNCQVHR